MKAGMGACLPSEFGLKGTLFVEIPERGVVYASPFTPPTALDTTGLTITPLGETVTVGDWDVTVLSTTPGATEAVLAENQFNDPPAANHQFYVVDVEATYNGTESESVFAGLTFTSVGASSVAYDWISTCGVIPNELDSFSEVFPGGTVTGSLCWSVDAADVDSLVLVIDAAFSFDEERAFVALR